LVTPVRIALIGTGNIVVSHLSAIEKMGERVELVAAVDVNEERLKAVCAEHNIPHAYTKASEMLAAEKPNLVHIITPPVSHTPLIIESLEAGAWVYCEKPLCASLAEFDEITQAEERTGRYVSTVFQWRFGSAAKHLKRLMGDGAFGRPLVGVCNTLWYRTQDYYNVSWRGKWATEFGGPTVSLGIHLADLFLWLMGDWQEVQSMIGTLERTVEFEDVALAMVRFESGAMGSIVNSALSPRQESALRLDFQKATVEVNTLYRYNNDVWRVTVPEGALDGTPVERWQAIEANISSGHDVQLGEILDSMARNERPPVSGLEARRILEFIASLYKAALTGKAVRRGEITPDDLFYYAMNGVAQTSTTS
jgi:predicted dehydrogenase